MDLFRRLLNEYLSVRPYLFGDYYPLLPYPTVADNWIAYQWDRPDLGEGMAQAFRQEESTVGSMTLKLQGLVPEAVYTLTNVDDHSVTEKTGQELMQAGVAVAIKDQPGSAIITYRRR
jgi:alpha-galactosidase